MNQWWKRSKPDELQPIPWLAPNVIEYLESLLHADMRVLEHGSGGSTLWLAARVKAVTSVEGDEKWRAQIKGRAGANVRLYAGNYPSDGMKRGRFDLLLIDGEPVETRATWLYLAEKIVKPGGWIVLDNANRPEYARERIYLNTCAELVQRFDGNQPGTLYLVTEFYRMEHASRP